MAKAAGRGGGGSGSRSDSIAGAGVGRGTELSISSCVTLRCIQIIASLSCRLQAQAGGVGQAGKIGGAGGAGRASRAVRAERVGRGRRVGEAGRVSRAGGAYKVTRVWWTHVRSQFSSRGSATHHEKSWTSGEGMDRDSMKFIAR